MRITQPATLLLSTLASPRVLPYSRVIVHAGFHACLLYTYNSYVVQNEHNRASGLPAFADPAWLQGIGVPLSDIGPTITAFERLLSRFRVASKELLRAYGL